VQCAGGGIAVRVKGGAASIVVVEEAISSRGGTGSR
jgi:hypothetical protein